MIILKNESERKKFYSIQKSFNDSHIDQDGNILHKDVIPIYNGKTIEFQGVIYEKNNFYNEIGEILIKFSNDKKINIKNVCSLKWYNSNEITTKICVFEQDDLENTFFYITQITNKKITINNQTVFYCKLYIYKGYKLIKTIENITEYIQMNNIYNSFFYSKINEKKNAFNLHIVDKCTLKDIFIKKSDYVSFFKELDEEQRSINLNHVSLFKHKMIKDDKICFSVSSGTSKNEVILEYFVLKKADYIRKIKNPFNDDETRNYYVEFSNKRKKEIGFIDYLNSIGTKLYGYDIERYYSALKEKYPCIFIEYLLDGKNDKYYSIILKDLYAKYEKRCDLSKFPPNTSYFEVDTFSQKKILNEWLVENYNVYTKNSLNKEHAMPSDKEYLELLKEYREYKEKLFSELLLNFPEIYKVKWKSEYDLFLMVSKLYNDAIYQYHCDWLGHQSLDIYIPQINVGIEYQGVQHYKPIKCFGGEEEYKHRKELDKKKRELCKKNEVKLIEWRYDEPIIKSKLKEKIKNFC